MFRRVRADADPRSATTILVSPFLLDLQAVKHATETDSTSEAMTGIGALADTTYLLVFERVVDSLSSSIPSAYVHRKIDGEGEATSVC